MPEYQYSALSRQGVEVSGSEQADSVEALTRQLKKQQITLLHARERKARKIPFAVIQAFLAELSPLASNGIPIDRALQIVGEDSGDPKIGELAAQLRKGIKRGESLSQALSQSGRFDSLLVALVRVGETSGELPRVLAIMETHYQEARQTRRDLVAALSYPAILALV
nr:type II secretion system F family protein [Zoogloea sp.]